jgi:hypothetical protein
MAQARTTHWRVIAPNGNTIISKTWDGKPILLRYDAFTAAFDPQYKIPLLALKRLRRQHRTVAGWSAIEGDGYRIEPFTPSAA